MLRDWVCITLGIHIAMGVVAFNAGALGWLAYCLVFICAVVLLLGLEAEPHNKEDYYDDPEGGMY